MANTSPQPIVIQADRMFDATGGEMREGVAVELVNGRVGRVGTDVTPREGGRIVRAAGCTLLPGLIDCHVHLNLSGSGNWIGEVGDSIPTLTLRSARFARQTLMGGVTTVR